MFWLEEGLPSSLRAGDASAHDALPRACAARRESRISPGERPAATSRSSGRCTRSSATSTSGSNLQEAIDAPEFHTDHLISSFYPRGFASKSLALESRFGSRTIADLQRRGHDVSVWPAWSAGRVTAVAREPDGLLRAGANPRGMQGYAVGR